jgi:hypothetical protein
MMYVFFFISSKLSQFRSTFPTLTEFWQFKTDFEAKLEVSSNIDYAEDIVGVSGFAAVGALFAPEILNPSFSCFSQLLRSIFQRYLIGGNMWIHHALHVVAHIFYWIHLGLCTVSVS